MRRLFLGKRGVDALEQAETTIPSNGGDEVETQRGLRHVLYVIRRDSLALFGLCWIIGLIMIALTAPLIAPYPTHGEGRTNPDDRLQAPSRQYAMGTDEFGRDIFSRVLYASRPALLASLIVVTVAVVIGAPLGAIAGYYGGWIDEIIMRITDMFLAFPSLLLAMTIVALLGPGLLNAVIALVASWWPWYTRLVRGVTISLRQYYFVEAARAMGVRDSVIIWRHILPNSISPIIVQATLDIGTVILATTALAFIGLGTQPPASDWGLMIEEGRQYLRTSWWYSTFPGMAIFLTVLAFNLLGDTLRDIFDPRQYR